MKVVELSGGVGGARMARGLAAVSDVDLTIVVNVGDDDEIHGLYVSPDLDTVVYTLAGLEGPEGWGRSGDTYALNDELARFGVDNRFLLGDRDLALVLFRTRQLTDGRPLSVVTRRIAAAFGLSADVVPATDDRLRTEVRVGETEWISFQDYFVFRRNRDEVKELRFAGAETAAPAPCVIESLDDADLVVIAPSNPPLSLWPILAVDPIREAVARHPKVVAVSPLFGGKALKGPADRVMASLGLPPGNPGVVAALAGLVGTLIVDSGDSADADLVDDVKVVATDTRIETQERARRLSEEMLRL